MWHVIPLHHLCLSLISSTTVVGEPSGTRTGGPESRYLAISRNDSADFNLSSTLLLSKSESPSSIHLHHKQRLVPSDHPRFRLNRLAQELRHGEHPLVRDGSVSIGSEPIELVHAQSRLMQYAAECADSNLAVSWHNCGASASIGRSSELDMAPSLADLCEACSPQSARDLTIWQRSKRHRLQPRWYAPSEAT